MLYHVSPVSGLRELRPRVSTHGRAYVYAAETEAMGLLFGAKQDDLDLLIDLDGGVPTVYECYPEALRAVYEGKRCSVYELREEGFCRDVTSWAGELCCETAVPVERETVVEDLYRRLLEEEARGALRLHRYATDAAYKHLISSHIVDRLIRFDLLDRAEEDPRLRTYFRGIVTALRAVMDGHLL